MRPAPREGRTRGAAPRQVRQRGRRAEAAFCHGGRRRKSTRDRVRPASRRKLQSTGRWTAAVGGGRLSVGVGRKRLLGHPLRLVQRMDAAASIRRSPSERMRRKELAGRQREGERGCRSGKAAFCLLLPAILVYRYTGILVKRGETVFLNKSWGGFLLILNRRRENGRISGRQTGTEGACAAAFCRFPLRCFGSECHTFGFKIATAALRPRNDTNLKRFCFGNGRFCFMRSFLRGAASHRFSNISF